MNIQSGTMVAPVPTGESVVKMHSQEDWAENLSGMKKISDPGSSALVKKKERILKKIRKMLLAEVELNFCR